MSRFALAALIALTLDAGVAAAADIDPAVDLAGQYRMQGKGFGANDSAYDGTCSLSREGPDYRVSCYNSQTRHTYSGRGLVSGDRLAIVIGDQLRGDHTGVFMGEYLVLYRRRADGVLEGTWIEAAGPASGSETLTPMR
jgi:hypothetical protein